MTTQADVTVAAAKSTASAQAAAAAADNVVAVAQAYAPPVVIPPQPTTTGNAILAAMAPGSLKCLVKANPFASAVGEPVTSYHVTDQAGWAYDDVNYCLRRAPSGGHAGTANDGMEHFDLATLAYIYDYAPIPYADRLLVNYDGQKGAWLDPKLTNPNSAASGPFPRPAARHSEQMNVYVPELNQLITAKTTDGNGTPDCAGDWPMGTQLGTQIGPGSNGYATYWACNRGLVGGMPNGLGGSSGEIGHWHVDAKQWTFHGAQCFPGFPKAMGEQQYGWTAMVYDAKSKLIWIVGRDAIWTYDPFNPGPTSRKRVKQLGIAGMGSAMAMVYYPPTDKYYFCCHFTNSATNPNGLIRVYEIVLDRVTPANTTVTLLSPTGSYATQSGLTSTTEMAFDYDPFTKKIWTGPFVNNGTISFTYFDPATMTLGSVNPTNTTDQGVSPNYLLFHMGRFDPRTGAWIWIDKGTARTWAWRPA